VGKLDITRRDFLNGVALGVAAATWPIPGTLTDEVYDLVVVGGGLSGLAAAQMYRQRVGGDPRILILDNHDDFGGHAKRNEFTVDGKSLIGYGGSQSIDSPARYSAASAQVLKDIGVITDRFYDYFDQDYFRDRNLARGIYFSRERYGRDHSAESALRFYGETDASALAAMIDDYPIPDAAKRGLVELLTSAPKELEGKSNDEKIRYLRGISYTDYLKNHLGVHRDVVLMLRDGVRGWWGVGYDALSALEAYRMGMPGIAGVDLPEDTTGPAGREEPYIFHFPDGNAGVARSFVRQLIPGAVPGETMEDLVRARVDYDALDDAANGTRIRLDSTAVDVRHAEGDRAVDVTYINQGSAYRVRGRHAILACYNRLVPHLCPEVPETQVDAINQAVKVPLVYISIAVRNWTAFENLGLRDFYIPQPRLMHSFGMDFPVSMGGYDFTPDSSQPTVIHGTYVPTVPDQGLSSREQHVMGRRRLYSLTFDEFEDSIVRVMSGALEPGGFDAERDIAGLTVNRWPHGYAYEYNDLFDPPDWSPAKGPHLEGAAQIGRISIANSDASAYAFVNGAFDAADRAVNEQLSVS
jgi:spermidine dehydrogenase